MHCVLVSCDTVLLTMSATHSLCKCYALASSVLAVSPEKEFATRSVVTI